MFDKLFTWAPIVRRHQEGPLASERAAYLEHLAQQGMAHGTLLRQSSYCLCVAREIAGFPAEKTWSVEEVDALARDWANRRVVLGRASSFRWPRVQFRAAAVAFLGFLGRALPPLSMPPGRYDAYLDEFLGAQRRDRWSDVTCRCSRWQVGQFLKYLEQRNLAIEDVRADDIDHYFEQKSQRWGRVSIRTAAHALRAWFAYTARRGLTQSNLAPGILLPHVYQQESLPIGPTWEQVSRMVGETDGDSPIHLRDRAILLLLSVYGLRSGEVRRLTLADVDWLHDRIRVVRSKSGREQLLPLETATGNAIAKYLRSGRPKSSSRVLFLRVRAPHQPLSCSGIYDVVNKHADGQIAAPSKGRGPHGLRHACARHLLESGRSMKEVGDHLGHRSVDATRIYAKVDLVALRRVAFEDMGGLS